MPLIIEIFPQREEWICEYRKFNWRGLQRVSVDDDWRENDKDKGKSLSFKSTKQLLTSAAPGATRFYWILMEVQKFFMFSISFVYVAIFFKKKGRMFKRKYCELNSLRDMLLNYEGFVSMQCYTLHMKLHTKHKVKLKNKNKNKWNQRSITLR